MKNTLLILLTVLVVGGTAATIVFREESALMLDDLKSRFGLERVESAKIAATGVVVLDTEPLNAERAGEAAGSSGPAVEASADTGIGSEQTAEEPAPEAQSNEYRNWKTRAGGDFEARLVWVSKSGKSLRFERRDGSTFLYSTEYLEPEHHAVVRSMTLAKNGNGGQVF